MNSRERANPMPAPTQQLVVPFDGTSNTAKDRTNIWRAHELLAAQDSSVSQEKPCLQGVRNYQPSSPLAYLRRRHAADPGCLQITTDIDAN